MKKIFSKDKVSRPLRAILTEACAGVRFISETDARVEPFFADAGAAELKAAVLRACGAEKRVTIEETGFEVFFDKTAAIQEWHGREEKENARRFVRLRKALSDNLDDIHVFRVGKTRIDIFIVGRDKTGGIAGARTFAVET